MSKRKPTAPFPIKGYAALAGIFALFLAIAYAVARWWAAKNNFHTVALLPVLVVLFACFLIACIYDALFDRLARKRLAEENARAAERTR